MPLLVLFAACSGSASSVTAPTTASPLAPASTPIVLVERPLLATESGGFSNDGGQAIADRFTFTEAVSLRAATWFGRHPGIWRPAPSEAQARFPFAIHLYRDAENFPADRPFRTIEVSVGRAAAGPTLEGSSWLSYSAEFAAVVLEPGVYWLSLTYLGNNADWLWGWSAAPGQGLVYRAAYSGPWRQMPAHDRGGAFTLSGTVTTSARAE